MMVALASEPRRPVNLSSSSEQVQFNVMAARLPNNRQHLRWAMRKCERTEKVVGSPISQHHV